MVEKYMEAIMQETNKMKEKMETSQELEFTEKRTKIDEEPKSALLNEDASLSDKELRDLFYKFETPLPLRGFQVMARHIQKSLGLAKAPEFKMLQLLRAEGLMYSTGYPRGIWADSEFKDWVAQNQVKPSSKASQTEQPERSLRENFNELKRLRASIKAFEDKYPIED